MNRANDRRERMDCPASFPNDTYPRLRSASRRTHRDFVAWPASGRGMAMELCHAP